MSYPMHDTDWEMSSSGNWWRRPDCSILIAGRFKNGRYWASLDHDYLSDSFGSLEDAQRAVEVALSKETEGWQDLTNEFLQKEKGGL